jgi:uncharacterized protein (UPF0332 family)
MNGLIKKGRDAAASARLLFDGGQYDGAVNRAYYAMFDAARAYLKLRHEVDIGEIKTHAGVLSVFNRHAVLDDGLSPDLTRSLHRAMAQRKQADYDELSVEREAAAFVLDEMERFLAEILDDLEQEPHP